MDVQTSSYGLRNVIASGPHSYVVADHPVHHRQHAYSLPPPSRPIVQAKPCYEIVQLVPTAVYIPVQEQKQKQNYSRPARVAEDPFLGEQYRPSRGTSAKIPHYNALDDPHMQDYYARKFGGRPRSAMKHSVRPDTLYRITVKTADVKDAGTNAKVYLTIVGSKDKICRKLLTHETLLRGHTQLSLSLNGLNKALDNDIYNLEFKRGATDIVFIRCRDLGVIHYIVVEHTGLLYEQSWLCEFILITNVRTDRSWLFPCNKWLSLFPPGDGSLSLMLYPNDSGFRQKGKSKKTPGTTEFEIHVMTGSEKGAGTDAQVYITLFGSDGKRTEKLHLNKSQTNNNPFERNQTDKFRVKGDYVGELVKARIEHDNSGRFAGWFLERIVVTDLYEPETKYFATCKKWLAKDEGDGQISRDLILHKDAADQRLNNRYRVTVYTGNKSGAGTDADVFITLYGDKGESGAIVLDDKKNNFEKGKKDEFTIECPTVGEINKILIAHNNKGTAPGWFLDRIIIEDLNEKRIYEFPCNKWLATDEDDGQISRYLFPKKKGDSDKIATGGVPYHITVYTGDKRNAGTDARVYIIMHGDKSSSSQIFFNDGKFEAKSIDRFKIDGPDEISPLSALDIGHDNTGMGPGWYLDKVVVDCPSTGITQTFPCNQWLASNEGDNRIERRLKEDLSQRKTRPPTVPWYIWIYTSDIRGAGTDAEVLLVLYGRAGKSDDIKLRSKSNVFEAGQCDEFKVDVTDVDIPYKLRVSHDNQKMFAAWHLDRIEMENLKTRHRYIFACGRWLSKKDDDKQIIRELPAEGPGIKKPLPVVKYTVDVHTGKQATAGTDANVFINIFGECGDTGERPLEYSTKNKNKFERNSVDTFIVEAVSLKHLRKIRIGHDGSGPGAGWFLSKIVVTPEDARYEAVTFECNRWLATDEDDGKIVRELVPGGAAQHLDKTSYHTRIKTGDCFGAGTDANVFMKIFGEKGDSDKMQLNSSDNTKNKFERGQIDQFTHEFDDLGKIKYILIGHDGKNPGAGWFLDWVEINIPMRGELYRFACNRWLDKNEDDHRIELELTPEMSKREIVIPYEITVFTGDKSGAGTDANVFIQMYGLKGKTEEILLRNRSDNFERKAIDKFKIQAPDIGQIQKIRIGHDSKSMGSAWYLEKVLIQRHVSKDFDRAKRGFKSGQSQRLSQISATDSNVEEYWFVYPQWYDKSAGDKQTVRELLPTDDKGNILSDRTEVTYKIHVFTGNKSGAGTDANVFLTIYGVHEDSGERELKKSNNANKFERNKEDIFDVKCISMGRLRKIKIRHDNSGPGPAWYLDRIEIVDPETSEVYHFICQKWLATNEDDGMISREIPALENKALRLATARESASGSSLDYALEMKAIATTYKISVVTGSEFGSGTDANVYIIVFGDHNDTGKVPLTVSKTHKDPFEKGHTDVFEIEAMDIGEPKKIKIGHDNAKFQSDWFLERVEIDIPKFGQTWKFPCGKWLSTSKGDRQLEVELYAKARPTETYTPKVPYEIKVYTSNKPNAGTDANVHIEIYGLEQSTGQVMLCSKTDRKGKFQTGSVDTFVLELDDVGEEIEKIRIGHDNKGFGAAWHLDRVEIRRLLEGRKTSTYVFSCDRWFAKNEDDKNIVRELVPDRIIEEKLDKRGQLKVKERDVHDRLEMKQYTVDVYTGDKSFCGTNANVYLTIFGDKGDTGERELSHSETHRDKFERKQVDRFQVESADLGAVYKVKIRHDNSGISPDWFLSRVEVIDGIKNYVFYCENWLAKGKGDSKLERTLYEKDYQGSKSSLGSVPRSIGGSKVSLTSNASEQKGEPFGRDKRKKMSSIVEDEESRGSTEDGIPYTVKIKTGEAKDAGTSANVFIRLFGRRGLKTRMIPLEVVQRQRFEPGKVETFSLQELDIGELEALEIEHDGDTLADSWFVDDINVEMPTKGRAYYFDCHQWFSKEKGDGRTKRILQVQDSNQGSFKPLIPYEVTFRTGDLDEAGCDGDVSLKLFGDQGSSSDHVIRKDEGNFERGAIDTFRCELDDVGRLIKVRVTIIPKQKKGRNKWYLESVEIIRVTKGNQRVKPYFFGLQNWISKESDSYRDIPLTKDGRALLSQTNYRVTTKTSDIDGAGSDSNVFIVISGQNGESGTLELKKSSTNRNKFERNNEDIFTFENILSLGELTKLRIWHDDAMFKGPWHLEYVKVEDLESGQTYMFPCNKWLSSKHDDKQVVRELVCENESGDGSRRGSLTPGGKVPYEIEVTTSDKKNAGTTQNAWIILEGNKKKRSDKFYMRNTQTKKILRSGQVNTFTFECRSLGDLRRIIIGHEERRDYRLESKDGREAQWHVAGITITDPSTGTRYAFPIGQWIDINNDGDIFECQDKQEDSVAQQRHRRLINYEIIVHTGDESGAGTDANVSIILYGTLGDTGVRPLKQKGRDLFERKQIDKFTIESLDLGQLTKLHIEHDNSGVLNADWLLDKVEVINQDTHETTTFPCNRWLGKKHDDGEIQRDLLPIHTS